MADGHSDSHSKSVTVEFVHPELIETIQMKEERDTQLISVELVSRKREILLKCPVCQILLDAHVRTASCLVDETMYCRACAQELGRSKERCWVCGIFTFHDMLELGG